MYTRLYCVEKKEEGKEKAGNDNEDEDAAEKMGR